MKKQTDRGEYCPHCHLKVALDTGKFLSRTVQRCAARPGGVQKAHIDCLLTAKQEGLRVAYALFGHLATGQGNGGALTLSGYCEKYRKRGAVRQFIDDLRRVFSSQPGCEAMARTAADLLNTDLLDPKNLRTQQAQNTASA